MFTLCLWVARQCEDTRGLAAWTRVWLCPQCDYDMCPVLAAGLGSSLLGLPGVVGELCGPSSSLLTTPQQDAWLSSPFTPPSQNSFHVNI